MTAVGEKCATSTLTEVLSRISDRSLASIICNLAGAITKVSELTSQGLTGTSGTRNTFGDKQLSLDVKSDDVILSALRSSPHVATASSEERAREIPLSDAGTFSVAYDPLDGSSVLRCNWSVGTIIGVWKGKQLVGSSGRDIVAGLVALYGPRTLLFVAVKELEKDGVLECEWRDGSWVVIGWCQSIQSGGIYAPGNLRAICDHAGYAKLVKEIWMANGRTLRYTGAMVPDVLQLLIKGNGVFCNVESEKAPAKLRILYEALPLAFVVEIAGGASSDGNISILDRKVESCEERTQICLGGKEDVEQFQSFCPRSS